MQPAATLLDVSSGARPAILSGWLYLPYEAIGGRAARDKLCARLTFRPRFQDPDAPREIALFHDWAAREYLGVPRAWGLSAFRGRGLNLIDKTTSGAHEVIVPKLPDFNHPRVLDPVAQQTFYEGIAARRQTSRGFIAKAGTGTGKTVVSLYEAGKDIRRPTLILLHLERLMWQWYEEIADKLGVPESRIGVAQSDRCDFEGKDFVVGMLHSVAQREYPRAFYRHFGHVIYDEVHKVGSQFFAPVVYRFPSRNWLGLSATVERTDGGETIFFCHLGGIAVTSTAAAMPMDVIPLRYTARSFPQGKSSSARLKWLSKDKRRNAWLVDQIFEDYRAGRNGLYVSEYVGHVQMIMDLCEARGIPREAMGQFTGQRHEGAYCPVVWEGGRPAAQRDEHGRVVTKMRKKDIKPEELAHAKSNCQLTFATYGMIVEGIDEPRWDCGMDLLPRGKATQLIGRIRRPLPSKPRPYWKTPYDAVCPISRRLFGKRCRDYRETGANVRSIA